MIELERAKQKGCVGVFVSASITGMSLTDPTFEPIWNAIDKSDLPVLIHPGAPPGVAEMDMEKYNLAFSVGFMFDTTLAISRMIFGGFFDTYKNIKIIACHAGGALPYLVGRLDTAFDNMPPCREVISEKPYLTATISDLAETKPDASNEEFTAIIDSIKDLSLEIIKESPNIPTEATFAIKNIESNSFLVNFV